MWSDHFVDSGGVRIAVRDFGGDGAPIVLVHGHYGNLANFDELGPLLAQHCRVLAYDQRGQGWSGSGPVSIDTFNADLDAVIAAFELADPWLYGGSFGALISLAYIAAGRRVAGLVIEDGVASDAASTIHEKAAPAEGPTLVSRDVYEEVVDGYAAFGPIGKSSAVRSTVRFADGSYEIRPSRAELHAKESAFLHVPVTRTYASYAERTLFLAARIEAPYGPERARHLDALSAAGVTLSRFDTGHWISAFDPHGVASETVAFIRHRS